MFKNLFESIVSPFKIQKREYAGMEARKIASQAVIGYNLTGEQSFAKLATLGYEIREWLDIQQRTSDEQMASVVENLEIMRSELTRLKEQSGLADRINQAYLTLASGVLDMGSEEPEAHRIIRLAVIASDIENKLWPDAEVLGAQCLFGLNGVPSYETLCENYGKHGIDLSIQHLTQERLSMLGKMKTYT